VVKADHLSYTNYVHARESVVVKAEHLSYINYVHARESVVVKALRYKPEGALTTT
jgi:hypothetical protein